MEQHNAGRMNELNSIFDELRTKNKEFDKRDKEINENLKRIKDKLGDKNDFAKEFEKAKKGEDRFPQKPYKSEIIRKYQNKNKK